MAEEALTSDVVAERVLLGDEAVAQAALDAGITAAYAYPGTPSTEILEYLVQHEKRHGGPKATWAANEKTAYEQGLGVSMMGRRSLVAMKHVGLNVAADPFVNSALVNIRGGLVVAVADDPGMHSSQNEQDTRILADFARIPCLEPSSQQEAYEMTREAFDLSERFHVPVIIRLVTRLCHSRAAVRVDTGRPPESARLGRFARLVDPPSGERPPAVEGTSRATARSPRRGRRRVRTTCWWTATTTTVSGSSRPASPGTTCWRTWRTWRSGRRTFTSVRIRCPSRRSAISRRVPGGC